jgi:exopolysaccharide production protein ExoQ
MTRPGSLKRMGALPVSIAIEVGFTILALYYFTDGVYLFSRPSADSEGNPLTYLLSSTIFLVTLVLLLRRPRTFWRASGADGALVLLLALTLTSALWSAAPELAFRRAVVLVGSALFGLYLHVRYSREQQLRLVGAALAVGIILSLLTVLGFFGSTVKEVTGVFGNKNSLGRMAALAALVFLFLARSGPRRWIPWSLIGLSILLITVAGSATALVVVVTLVSLLPLFKTLKRDARPAVVLACIAVLVVGAGLMLLAPTLDALAGVVGRNATLTGRVPLWAVLIQMISERPWLGYGYETFWLTGLPFRLVVDEGAGWTAPNAHNGFLEVALSLGLVGLFLYLLILGRGVKRAVRVLRVEHGPLALWPLVYVGFQILYNVTESTSLPRLSLCWVLFVTTLLEVSPREDRETLAARIAARRGGPHLVPPLGYAPARRPSRSRGDQPSAGRVPHVGS